MFFSQIYITLKPKMSTLLNPLHHWSCHVVFIYLSFSYRFFSRRRRRSVFHLKNISCFILQKLLQHTYVCIHIMIILYIVAYFTCSSADIHLYHVLYTHHPYYFQTYYNLYSRNIPFLHNSRNIILPTCIHKHSIFRAMLIFLVMVAMLIIDSHV